MVDAGALVRGIRQAGAVRIYDAFVSSMWRHNVFLTPTVPANTKTINDWGLLFVTRVMAKVSYTEGNVKILRSLLRLDSPLIYKTIQANRLVRTFLNVTARDESEWYETGHSVRSTCTTNALLATCPSVNDATIP
jgi:hypothetical protein